MLHINYGVATLISLLFAQKTQISAELKLLNGKTGKSTYASKSFLLPEILWMIKKRFEISYKCNKLSVQKKKLKKAV